MHNYRERIFNKYVSRISSDEEYHFYTKGFDFNYSRFLPVNKDARILELGSGPGSFLYFLESKGYTNYIGVDLSPRQVEKAQNHCRGQVVCDDISHFLKTDTDTFGLIVIRHALEHFYKDEIFNILDDIRAHLEPEGKLIVEVPNCGSPVFGSNSRYTEFTHEIGFTIKSLQEALHAADFKIIFAGPMIVPSVIKRLCFAALNFSVRALSKKPLLFDTAIYAVASKDTNG